MKILILMTLVLLNVMSCSSSSTMSNEKKAGIYYNEGTKNLVAGEYTAALRDLIEAYKLNPNDSKILNNLGMAYYFKGDKEQALKYLNDSLKIDNKNSDARMNIATIYMNQNQLEDAENQYKLILKDLVYGGQFKTYFNLAQIALKKNNSLQAKNYLKQSINVFENYCPAHYQLGEIAFEEKNYTQALKHFHDSSLGVCYNNAEPFIKQADTLTMLNRIKEARSILEDVLKRFLTTKYEDVARNKLYQLNRKEGITSDLDQESRLLKEEENSAPNF